MPAPLVHLEKAKCLPIMQKAFLEKRLQAQDPAKVEEECMYTGPCVIGVCLTPEQQAICDYPTHHGFNCVTGIKALIAGGAVTTDDDTFFMTAQLWHDNAMRPEDNKTELALLAKHLELITT